MTTSIRDDLSRRLARLRELPEPRADVLVDGQLPDLYARKVFAILGATVTDRGPHIAEQAGFNVALLECPPGKGVGLHNHATAEVLMPLAGEWRFQWGREGEERVTLKGGDVFSVPAGVYRCFTNRSREPQLLFAVVQGDGVANAIRLSERVIAEGRARGFQVDEDGRVLGNGLSFQPRTVEIPDLHYPREEVLRHIARFEALEAREIAPGVAALPALGKGAKVHDDVGFGLSFLRARASSPVPVGGTEVHLLMPLSGTWALRVEGESLTLHPTDVFALKRGWQGELSCADEGLCLSLRGAGEAR